MKVQRSIFISVDLKSFCRCSITVFSVPLQRSRVHRFQAESRVDMSERSEFVDPPSEIVPRGKSQLVGAQLQGAFSFVTFLWSKQRKVSL